MPVMPLPTCLIILYLENIEVLILLITLNIEFADKTMKTLRDNVSVFVWILNCEV